MPAKLFISYSNVDEEHRQALETHLASMRRNHEVETWCFRRIIAGQEPDTEIDHHLQDSDVILFLISPDFLASDYCNDVEIPNALALREQKSTTLIPVIVRHCDWKSTTLGALQALPAAATPVSDWSDKDKAWFNVVEGLRQSIRLREGSQLLAGSWATDWSSPISESHASWLEDMEVKLTHPNVASVSASDIFVPPDLKDLTQDISKLQVIRDAAYILRNPGLYLVLGGEQTGKTALAKYYCRELLKSGWLPIFLGGTDVTSSDLNAIVTKAYAKQYSKEFDRESWHSAQKVLIIDDFSSSALNTKYRNVLLESIQQQFNAVVLLALDTFRYVIHEIEGLDGFHLYEILQFGHVKRAELIQQWISLGVAEQLDEADLYANIDRLKGHIDHFVKRSIVPSKPIYLFALLQLIEDPAQHRLELTAYGHCYQHLIFRALTNANIRQTEIDSYLNFLTEFANAVFANDGNGLSDVQFEEFLDQYQQQYIGIDRDRVLSILVGNGILLKHDDLLAFKYRYIYYFYAAKYLSEHVARDDSQKQRITELLPFLHREDSANIVIFITHHTRNPWVLDEIGKCMSALFAKYEEATLRWSQEIGQGVKVYSTS